MLVNFPVEKRFKHKPDELQDMLGDLLRALRVGNEKMQLQILEKLLGKSGSYISGVQEKMIQKMSHDHRFLDELEELNLILSHDSANDFLYQVARLFEIDLIAATNIYLKVRKSKN